MTLVNQQFPLAGFILKKFGMENLIKKHGSLPVALKKKLKESSLNLQSATKKAYACPYLLLHPKIGKAILSMYAQHSSKEKTLDREIYLIPPKECKKPGKIWRLLRCAYGLNDASRYWYLKIKEVLIKLGCKCSKLDAAVFMYHNNENELLGLCSATSMILCGLVQNILWMK